MLKVHNLKNLDGLIPSCSNEIVSDSNIIYDDGKEY